jgi:hypothetical protein
MPVTVRRTDNFWFSAKSPVQKPLQTHYIFRAIGYRNETQDYHSGYNLVTLVNGKGKRMENDFNFDLEDREKFKINPETWLHTLLAIVGDREKREEAVRQVTQKTGFSPEEVKVILKTTISVLINQTRAN